MARIVVVPYFILDRMVDCIVDWTRVLEFVGATLGTDMTHALGVFPLKRGFQLSANF